MNAMRLGVLCSLSMLVGCEAIDSEDLLTSGIYAELTAITEGEGTGTETQAILKSGGKNSNTYVRLTADDSVTVSAGEELDEMGEQNLGNYYVYSAELLADTAGTEVTFALNRTIDEGAPSSVATVPEPFDLTSPVTDAVFSRTNDALTVSWEPSGTTDEVEIRITGNCFFDHYEFVDGDPGTWVLEAGTLATVEGQEDEACDTDVEVYRKRTGVLDPGYNSGTVWGAQLRKANVRADP